MASEFGSCCCCCCCWKQFSASNWSAGSYWVFHQCAAEASHWAAILGVVCLLFCFVLFLARLYRVLSYRVLPSPGGRSGGEPQKNNTHKIELEFILFKKKILKAEKPKKRVLVSLSLSLSLWARPEAEGSVTQKAAPAPLGTASRRIRRRRRRVLFLGTGGADGEKAGAVCVCVCVWDDPPIWRPIGPHFTSFNAKIKKKREKERKKKPIERSCFKMQPPNSV